MEFMEDFIEEMADFFEDIGETIFHKPPKTISKTRRIMLYGTSVAVRPAFAFAERIESSLKTIFGLSILISGIIASFWGYTGLSDLLDLLIHTIIGRIFMVIIGLSYMIIGLWKLSQLKKGRGEKVKA